MSDEKVAAWKVSDPERLKWFQRIAEEASGDKRGSPWATDRIKEIAYTILDSKEATERARVGDDAGIAALLKFPRETPVEVRVTKIGLAALIGEVPTAKITLTLKQLSKTDGSDPVQEMAAEIASTRLEMLSVGGPGILLSDPLCRNAMQELLQGGVITEEDIQKIDNAIFPKESPQVDLVGAALLPFRVDGKITNEMP